MGIKLYDRSCPGYIMRPWRIHKEYVIYNYATEEWTASEMHPERVKAVRKRHSNGSGSKKLVNDVRPNKRVSHNGSHLVDTPLHHVSNDTLEDIDCLQGNQIDCINSLWI